MELFTQEYFNNIKTKEDFLLFLEELQKDFLENSTKWEKDSIDGYLESIRAWVNDSSKLSNDKFNWNTPNWSLVAVLFYMGKTYE